MNLTNTINPVKEEFWKHEDVLSDGSIKGYDGSVGTEFSVRFFLSGSKCTCGTCRTVYSYIVKNYGLENGVVQGKTTYFDSDKDLLEYVEQKGIREIN